MEQAVEEVKRDRRTYIGSRDIAALFGEDPWVSEFDLWQFKKFGVQKEVSDFVKSAGKWGLLLEDIVLDECAKSQEIEIIERQVHVSHKQLDFIAGTADAIANFHDQRCLLEAKTTSQWNKSYESEPPTRVYMQTQWLMGLLDLKIAIVPVLFGGQSDRTYVLEFDARYFEMLVAVAEKWWKKYVLGDAEILEPAENLAAKKDTEIEATEDILQTIHQLKNIKKDKKILEKKEEMCEKEIKEFMRENELLSFQSKKICSWKEQERKSLDNERVSQLIVGREEEFMNKTSYRVLRVSCRVLRVS